jgi:hypothetical protein
MAVDNISLIINNNGVFLDNINQALHNAGSSQCRLFTMQALHNAGILFEKRIDIMLEFQVWWC